MNWKPIYRNDEGISKAELQLVVKLLALEETLFKDLGFAIVKIHIKEVD